MKITIKHPYTNADIYNGEGENLKEVLEKAVAENANLTGADLRWADLRWADLRWANLTGANLTGAYLTGAYLYGVDLHGAYLYGVDLHGANLTGADLYGANLTGANLREADLRGANLRESELYGANLYGANLTGANLGGAKGIPELTKAQNRVCAEGTITGWKKLANGLVLQLEIPADAKRVNALGSRKCRASYAIPCAVYDDKGTLVKEPGELRSRHDNGYTYTLGEACKPDSFNDSITEECAPGIHFFITFEEAATYE